MSITLGVFDIFAYGIPGSLYLTVLTYISRQLGWINSMHVVGANTTLVLAGAAIASYLIGHLSYALGRTVSRIVPIRKKDMADARAEFIRRVPAAYGRAYVAADRAVLLTAVEVRQPNASLEISRLRAVGIMMRNSAPALALGSLVAAVEIVTSHGHWFAASCFVVLSVATAEALWNAPRLAHWADMKTLEIAFWIPGIDETFTPENNKRIDRANDPATGGQQ